MALRVLGHIHGRIGSTQQAVRRCAVVRIEGHPNACPSTKNIAFYCKWRVEAALKTLRNLFDSGAAAHHWNKSGKLIATQSCQHVTRA